MCCWGVGVPEVLFFSSSCFSGNRKADRECFIDKMVF